MDHPPKPTLTRVFRALLAASAGPSAAAIGPRPCFLQLAGSKGPSALTYAEFDRVSTNMARILGDEAYTCEGEQ
jgi:hypothetical protein